MNTWLPSLNSLRAFEAVARHLSYTAAADELNVTPGAVKHLVAKLERDIGHKLLMRHGQNLQLTPIGQHGKADLSKGMKSFTEAVRKMRNSRENRSLVVSVEASLAATWLAPRLNDFFNGHPDIDVYIDASQKIVDLPLSKIDVAIRYGVESAGELVCHRLFQDIVVPACSPNIADGPPKLESLEQLRNLPLIHWDTSHMGWAHATRRWFSWDVWFRHAGIEGVDTSRGRRYSDYGLAVQAAVSGQGMLLAGWPGLIDTLEEGLLVCPFRESALATDIGFDLVTTNEARQRPEVEIFCDWLLATARATPSFH